MSSEESKDLCREAWKKKCSYLKVTRLDDEKKIFICNESKKEHNFFQPQTKPF